ncbi:hypothetical protein [Calothrix sp. NIES-2100]|uniref:hypothetical protein n=1 Tax=Calothrix sp. NIES-2100 TaxID=1954172 RepID=UPI0030DBE615
MNCDRLYHYLQCDRLSIFIHNQVRSPLGLPTVRSLSILIHIQLRSPLSLPRA